MTIDSIVRVTATIEPTPAAGPTFGRTLLLFTGDASGTTRAAIAGARARDLRVTRYTNLAALAEDFPATHAAYRAAAAYFQQVPFPREFITAGWHATGAKSYILGATGFSEAADLTAIKNVGSTFIGAAGQSVTVNLNVAGTGTTGFTAVATAIQTALRTIPGLNQVSVTYSADDTAYQVEAPIGVDLLGVLTGPGAEAVGLGSTAGYYPGVPVETITDALTRIQRSDDTWYWLLLAADLVASDSAVTVTGWVRPQFKQLVMAPTGVDVLTANESASRAAQVAALATERNLLIWSGTVDYKDASVAGRFAGTDFDAVDSLPTLFAKSLPGRAPDVLTTAQRNELDRKRINYYETVGGHAIVRPGVSTRVGWWPDTRYWLDWLIQRIQTDVYTLLRSNTRIPLTDRGAGLIQATVEAACEAGRRNGGIAPGRVSAAATGQIRQATGADFNGTLSRGYLVHVGSVDDLSIADRAARNAPPITVWLKGSSAVHFADIELSFTP